SGQVQRRPGWPGTAPPRLARYSAAPAMSSGRPMRPSGAAAAIWSPKRRSVSAIIWPGGVGLRPGGGGVQAERPVGVAVSVVPAEYDRRVMTDALLCAVARRR